MHLEKTIEDRLDALYTWYESQLHICKSQPSPISFTLSQSAGRIPSRVYASDRGAIVARFIGAGTPPAHQRADPGIRRYNR